MARKGYGGKHSEGKGQRFESPRARQYKRGSVPDTWVTVYTGDIGNTSVVVGHWEPIAKPLARYGVTGARFASGFAGGTAGLEAGRGPNTFGPNGFSSGSSLQV